MKRRLLGLMVMGIATTVVAGMAMACSCACGKPDGEQSACGDGPCAVEKPAAPATIGTATLAELIKAKQPLAILDARSGKWDDGRRLPGARSVTAESTDAEIAAALPNKDQMIVTYCGGLKCPLSHALAERLRALGYSKVVEYSEGIAGWVAAGQPVEQRK
jgi:rhodanese-related sulfurtransferase